MMSNLAAHRRSHLDQRVSGTIGVFGGGLDIIIGALLLQESMTTAAPEMMSSWLGVLLLILGVIVLTSGMYLFNASMMANGPKLGRLMLLYGILMLAIGFAMITGTVGVMMMRFSSVSGVLMIVSGLAMIYSGFGMRKV
jgi:hypothetical protein